MEEIVPSTYQAKRKTKSKKVVTIRRPRAKLLCISGRAPSRVFIGQRDIVELQFLRKGALQARKAFESKREEIRNALVRGALIEPGLHTAKFSTRYLVIQ